MDVTPFASRKRCSIDPSAWSGVASGKLHGVLTRPGSPRRSSRDDGRVLDTNPAPRSGDAMALKRVESQSEPSQRCSCGRDRHRAPGRRRSRRNRWRSADRSRSSRSVLSHPRSPRSMREPLTSGACEAPVYACAGDQAQTARRVARAAERDQCFDLDHASSFPDVPSSRPAPWLDPFSHRRCCSDDQHQTGQQAGPGSPVGRDFSRRGGLEPYVV